MTHSFVARRARAIAGHADYLLIAALVVAKLAGVEVRVVRRGEPAPVAAVAPAADVRAVPAAAVRLIRVDGGAAAEESGCQRGPRLFPRPESRRELRERRARTLLFGSATPPAPRQAS